MKHRVVLHLSGLSGNACLCRLGYVAPPTDTHHPAVTVTETLQESKETCIPKLPVVISTCLTYVLLLAGMSCVRWRPLAKRK